MRTDRWMIVVIVALLVLSASLFAVKTGRRSEEASSVPSSPGSLSLLVVGVEGMDLGTFERLSEEGRLPNLTSLVSKGSLCEFQSLPRSVDHRIAWTSLVTGVSPENQGIGGTILSRRGDGKRIEAPLVPASRTVGTLWTALSDAGTPVGVLGWWGTWPVEQLNGVVVAPYVTYYLERKHDGDPAQLLYPADMLDRIDPLIKWPESYDRMDLARFVHFDEGFGAEALIGKGYIDLATAYAGDRSMVNVAEYLTVDPGVRAELVLLPGVELVCQIFWLMVHTDQIDWDFLSDTTRRTLEGQIPALRDVIDLYYESVDERIGELLKLAADDATVTVVSSNGYDKMNYGASRQPLLGNAMHDETGFWIMTGPKVKSGVRLSGLDVLDFAPTVAAAAGIELGDDVEGKAASSTLLN